MEASPKPKPAPELRVIETPEHEREVPAEIPLLGEGYLSLKAPPGPMFPHLAFRAESAVDSTKAVANDLRAAIHRESLTAFSFPKPDELDALERVRCQIDDQSGPFIESFEDVRGNQVEVRSRYRAGRSHPERLVVVLYGLGGHKVNSVKQIESEHLEDYSILLAARPGSQKRLNGHLVRNPDYGLDEHIENCVRSYVETIVSAVRGNDIEHLVLAGHSMGGPYALQVAERLREEYPQVYEKLGGVILEQTSGYGNMATKSALDGTLVNARVLRKSGEILYPWLRNYGQMTRSVDAHLPDNRLGQAMRGVGPQQVFRALVSARSTRLKVGNEELLHEDAIKASLAAAKQLDWEFFITEFIAATRMPTRRTMYDHDVPTVTLRGQGDQLLSRRACEEAAKRLRGSRDGNHERIGSVEFPRAGHYVKAEKAHAEPVSVIYRQMLTEPEPFTTALHQENDDPKKETPRWHFHPGKAPSVR